MKKIGVCWAMVLGLALSVPAVAGAVAPGKIDSELTYLKENKHDPAIEACRAHNLTREQQDAMLCKKLGECTPDPSSTCEYRVQRWFDQLKRQIYKDPEQYFYGLKRSECSSRVNSKKIDSELTYLKENKHDPAIEACRAHNLTREQQDAMLCEKLGECTPDPSSTCEYRVQRWFDQLKRQIYKDPEQYFYGLKRSECDSR